jgi:hypothetical protein
LKSIRKPQPLVTLLVTVVSAYPVSSSLSTPVNPQPQSVNLVLGNPGDATTDPNDEHNFLMVKPHGSIIEILIQHASGRDQSGLPYTMGRLTEFPDCQSLTTLNLCNRLEV